MPDDPRPPVAIRVTRPYATEAEFLEQELDTLTRTSITLLGAQARPQGVVLRFELVLSSGHVLVRGEGRVVGFKANAHQGNSGLTLRFTRLDSKSKALVDKVASLRERRRPSAMPGVPDAPGPAPDAAAEAAPESIRPAARSMPPPLPPRASKQPPPLPPRASKQPPAPPSSDAALLLDDPPIVPPPPRFDLESTHAEVPAAKRSSLPPAPPAAVENVGVAAPRDRDALLERLRARAKTLDAAAVREILQQRRRA